MSSFEVVWVPIESFALVYSYFVLHRPEDLTVMIHPLTTEETKGHTSRAVFLGKEVPLKLHALQHELPEVPKQYPELGLGYSML